MSRLWSRFGVRALAVLLLLVGVAGGLYLGQDRDIQQQGIEAHLASRADLAEQQLVKERHSAHTAALAPQREAQADAAAKAADAAKAAAERARKAESAVSRKKEREKAQAQAAAAADGGSDAEPPPFAGPVPESCNEYSGNRRTGCAMMLDAGHDIDQFPCLDKLWAKESGWNHRASNPSSGAYGIPQALPGGKMASAGDDWETNPATQIAWGLGYIKGRYNNPCGAWQHSQNVGWY